MRPRTGHIQFLNCLPIYYGLVNGNGILDLELVKGTPTELNSLLLGARLDISPVSSIEYARNPERLILLPGPTVSCRGPVQSILLVSTCPLQELHGEPVGLTGTSATSHVLLRIILERHHGIRPRYFPFGDSLADALDRGKAALLIGDRALEHLSAAPGLYVYDLGREWWDYAGEGMVFAVWAVHRTFADSHPEVVEHAWRLFQESIDFCRSNLDAIAVDAARWERFPADFLQKYFRSLSFDFDKKLRSGLLRFYREAVELEELETVPPLNFFSPAGVGSLSRGPLVP